MLNITYLRSAHVVNSHNSKVLVRKVTVACFPLISFLTHFSLCVMKTHIFCSLHGVSVAVWRPNDLLSLQDGGMLNCHVKFEYTAVKGFHCIGTGWNSTPL